VTKGNPPVEKKFEKKVKNTQERFITRCFPASNKK
jgi:hypothetical protein